MQRNDDFTLFILKNGRPSSEQNNLPLNTIILYPNPDDNGFDSNTGACRYKAQFRIKDEKDNIQAIDVSLDGNFKFTREGFLSQHTPNYGILITTALEKINQGLVKESMDVPHAIKNRLAAKDMQDELAKTEKDRLKEAFKQAQKQKQKNEEKRQKQKEEDATQKLILQMIGSDPEPKKETKSNTLEHKNPKTHCDALNPDAEEVAPFFSPDIEWIISSFLTDDPVTNMPTAPHCADLTFLHKPYLNMPRTEMMTQLGSRVLSNTRIDIILAIIQDDPALLNIVITVKNPHGHGTVTGTLSQLIGQTYLMTGRGRMVLNNNNEGDIEYVLAEIRKYPVCLDIVITVKDLYDTPVTGTLLQLAAMAGDVNLKPNIINEENRGLVERLITAGNMPAEKVIEQLQCIFSDEAKRENEERIKRYAAIIKKFEDSICESKYTYVRYIIPGPYSYYLQVNESLYDDYIYIVGTFKEVIAQFNTDLKVERSKAISSGFIFDPIILYKAAVSFDNCRYRTDFKSDDTSHARILNSPKAWDNYRDLDPNLVQHPDYVCSKDTALWVNGLGKLQYLLSYRDALIARGYRHYISLRDLYRLKNSYQERTTALQHLYTVLHEVMLTKKLFKLENITWDDITLEPKISRSQIQKALVKLDSKEIQNVQENLRYAQTTALRRLYAALHEATLIKHSFRLENLTEALLTKKLFNLENITTTLEPISRQQIKDALLHIDPKDITAEHLIIFLKHYLQLPPKKKTIAAQLFHKPEQAVSHAVITKLLDHLIKHEPINISPSDLKVLMGYHSLSSKIIAKFIFIKELAELKEAIADSRHCLYSKKVG